MYKKTENHPFMPRIYGGLNDHQMWSKSAKLKPKLKWTKRIVITMVGTVALLGTVYQMVEVSLLYFARETASELSISRPHRPDLPAITLCTKFGTYKADHNATPKFLLSSVPLADQLIRECKVRHKSSYLINELIGQAECGKVISSTRFVLQHFVCLRYKVIDFKMYR